MTAAAANEKAAYSEREEQKRELCDAVEKIKLLETVCAGKDDILRQTQARIHLFEVSQTAMIQNMARLVQSQTVSSDDAATSPRCNAFDDFNSDLKLQVEAGRALIASLRQELSDAQDCVAVMQKQLAREKEQV